MSTEAYAPSHLLDTMCRVARECGRMMREADFAHAAAKIKTSRRDLVTEYDVKIQACAVEALAKAFPDAHFICEEGASAAPAEDGLTFVIDPIDGTTNFIHGFGHSCTSIACVQGGQPVAGAIYDVYKDELFTAEKDRGAYLNGKPIRVHGGSLAESIVMFGTSPYNTGYAEETFRRVREIYGRCQDVRRSGSAALDLCYAACGRVGLFFESELSLWDFAAGALIVREAGGVCLTLTGEPMTFTEPHKCSGLAGSARCVRESGLLPQEFNI